MSKARRRKNPHLGSNFDSFLAEEGLLEDAELVALKRVIAYRIQELMLDRDMSKTQMAREMRTSRAALDRLLQPENTSVTLQTLGRAARALGRRLEIRFEKAKRAA